MQWARDRGTIYGARLINFDPPQDIRIMHNLRKLFMRKYGRDIAVLEKDLSHKAPDLNKPYI